MEAFTVRKPSNARIVSSQVVRFDERFSGIGAAVLALQIQCAFRGSNSFVVSSAGCSKRRFDAPKCSCNCIITAPFGSEPFGNRLCRLDDFSSAASSKAEVEREVQ